MRLFALTLALTLPALAAAPDKPGTILGNAVAPVRIEVLSDFMCPSCKTFHDQTLPLLTKEFVNTGKAYIVFREFPLSIPGHEHSRTAANYAVASARVGKYQQVSGALFGNTNAWGTSGKVWETVAAVLTPAEQKRVQALAKDSAVLSEVEGDVKYGQSGGVNSTPTLILMRGSIRYPVSGTMKYDLLRSMLYDLLKK